MTVQQLIDELSKIEDKTRIVVNEYDGYYNQYSGIATITLYTNDGGTNLYDYNEEVDNTPINCVLIDTQIKENNFTFYDDRKYFYLLNYEQSRNI